MTLLIGFAFFLVGMVIAAWVMYCVRLESEFASYQERSKKDREVMCRRVAQLEHYISSQSLPCPPFYPDPCYKGC